MTLPPALEKPVGGESSAVPAVKEVQPAAKKNGAAPGAVPEKDADKEGPCGLPAKCVVL